MGFNTTVVVLNDGLEAIRRDPAFGENLVQQILSISVREGRRDVPALNHANAASVVETHHADSMSLIAVGGNLGRDLGHAGGYRANDLELIKNIADKMGYRLVKKTSRPR